jgi:ribonuclease-3
MLFVNNLKENEGILSKKRAHLVSREICYQIGITIGIPDAIILSDGEQANGGRLLLANVANCLEAIIAAIYIDSGYDLVYVRKFINKYWGDFITQNNTELIGNDSKTALQEWSQMRFKVVPVYNIIGHEGNPHSPIFKIEVAIRDLPRITGTGKSKKDAEKDAASKMLKLIKQLDI